MFTEQMCKDVGITLGMPENKSVHFYHHYNAQGWLYPSGIKITNLKSAMWRWQKNDYKFKSKEEKTQETKTKEQIHQRQKEKERIRDEYQEYLERKTTKALKDLKKDGGHIVGVCGWLIDEILAKR